MLHINQLQSTSAGALAITRDASNGRITSTTLGNVTTSVTYDGYSIPNRLTASFAANPIFDMEHLHDSLGRIVSVTEIISGVTTAYAYSYDATGRLVTVTKNGAPEASYQYDVNGNRTSVTNTLGSQSVTTDAQDRILTQGTASFSYTKDGELRESVTGVDTTRYTYGARAELRSVRLLNGTLIEYVLDPHGRRIGKKINGTLVRGWLYGTGLGPVAELDASNNVVSRFVYAGRPNVPEYMVKAGVTYRFVHDHLGSVRLVVNTSTGAIAQRLDYDAWGGVLANSAPDFQPFGFAGGLFDAQTGLVRFGARDYAATQGHFTSRDPEGFAAGATNQRRYANADPVNQADRGGQQPTFVSLVQGLAFAELLWSAGASFIAGCTVKLNEASANLDDASSVDQECLKGGLPQVTATVAVHLLHIDDIPVFGPCLASAVENALGVSLDRGFNDPKELGSREFRNEFYTALAAGCAGGVLGRLASKSAYFYPGRTKLSYAEQVALKAVAAVAENAFTTVIGLLEASSHPVASRP
ncbi:MAG: RHS repeat domain-containing protein [Gemmatimonadaceae bacterium]